MNFSNELWNQIRTSSSNFEQSIDKLKRKQTGCYFTSLELTEIMINEMIQELSPEDKKNIHKKRFLEPCVGTGNFVFAYLKICSKLGLSKKEFQELINNIYVCDVNKEATSLYSKNLKIFVNQLFGIQLTEEYFKSHIGNELLFNIENPNSKIITLKDVFGEDVAKRKFDIIATNPPYKNLKAENSHYSDEEEKKADKTKYSIITESALKYFKYSITGTLNLYKMFVEEIIENYLADNGSCSLLIPSSILSDKTCEKLRNRMLFDYKIISIKTMREENPYVDAKQAICAILLKKGKKSQLIRVTKDYDKNTKSTTSTTLKDLINPDIGNAIVVLSESEYRIVKVLRKFPTIKEINFIENLRGELDLTFDKNAIISEKSQFRLIRGRDIGLFEINDSNNINFVSEDFVNKSFKREYVKTQRIACQQIANQSKKKRVIFSPIPPNTVLGNSCNFIAIKKNDKDVDLDWLIGILNSSLINWLFKLTSSNNHINNYEIDSLPIPIDSINKNEIRSLVRQYFEQKKPEILDRIDQLVCTAFGVQNIDSPDGKNTIDTKNIVSDLEINFFNDAKFIMKEINISSISSLLSGNLSIDELLLQQGSSLSKFEKKVMIHMYEKYVSLNQNKILNHTSFKLSDLDLEMIRAVPQGGNWKNIPLETIVKSERLKRIKQTGGRTTLYGRIDYEKPSYTITTYFNRPGNGTYVHPIHDRVISVREAARFQSFLDDYYFYGNKTQVLKQVGNAVPVFLAYQIAKKIVNKTSFNRSLDLFCGAGGFTSGFKAGGIQSILSTDIEESACLTLKINNPEIPVLCGDITNTKIKDEIINHGINNKADIICGGPPCQGFSMAGFRQINDPRNILIRDFADIVSAVKPKIIVFENVEGLLTIQNGLIFRNILYLFSELGYNAIGKMLFAHHFGIPQRRKRVILICTRKDLLIDPVELFPNPCTENDENQVTAFETISDLQDIECGKGAFYRNIYGSKYIQLLKKQFSYDEYLNNIEKFRIKKTQLDSDIAQISLFNNDTFLYQRK